LKNINGCPSEVSNIVLTDELKEHLMQNRVWKPTISLTPLNPHEAHERTLAKNGSHKYGFVKYTRKCRGTLYLIQVFPNNPIPVFKVGKTKRFVGERLEEYEPHTPILMACCECYDCDAYEKELLAIFKTKFTKRPDMGLEYFTGDPNLMKQTFLQFMLDKQSIECTVIANDTIEKNDVSPQMKNCGVVESEKVL